MFRTVVGLREFPGAPVWKGLGYETMEFGGYCLKTSAGLYGCSGNFFSSSSMSSTPTGYGAPDFPVLVAAIGSGDTRSSSILGSCLALRVLFVE